jgi:hypothetical protein
MSAKKEHYDRKTDSPSLTVVEESRKEYMEAMQKGMYDVARSFFDSASGGYLLYHAERKFNQVEYDAARYLALAGERVIATPEKGEEFISLEYVDRNGKKKKKYGDGKIAGVIYEQSTPDKPDADFNLNVERAVYHAFEKHAKIALIYDAHGLMHRENIKTGMENYKEHNKSPYDVVERVCVIDKDGGVHWWKWE